MRILRIVRNEQNVDDINHTKLRSKENNIGTIGNTTRPSDDESDRKVIPTLVDFKAVDACKQLRTRRS